MININELKDSTIILEMDAAGMERMAEQLVKKL